MPSLIKYHPHGSVLFSTFSLEEGLFLLANPLCELIVQNCLARAQKKYGVKICHFIVNANHIHLIFVVDNPDDIFQFIRYFKTESAHRINRILGRDKRTVWCEGYDSPVVLSLVRALVAIGYLYANPAKDNLVESIEHFPGLSSWKMVKRKEHTKHWPKLSRIPYEFLPNDAHNQRGYSKEAERLRSTSSATTPFTIEPNAWLDAYGITDPKEQEFYNERIKQRVQALEARAAKKRELVGKRVIGREQLQKQVIDPYYRSKRAGKRMWCLSEKRELRIRFIKFLRELREKAHEVRAKWQVGDFSEPYPLGLYPPSMPKLAEPLAVW